MPLSFSLDKGFPHRLRFRRFFENEGYAVWGRNLDPNKTLKVNDILVLLIALVDLNSVCTDVPWIKQSGFDKLINEVSRFLDIRFLWVIIPEGQNSRSLTKCASTVWPDSQLTVGRQNS